MSYSLKTYKPSMKFSGWPKTTSTLLLGLFIIVSFAVVIELIPVDSRGARGIKALIYILFYTWGTVYIISKSSVYKSRNPKISRINAIIMGLSTLPIIVIALLLVGRYSLEQIQEMYILVFIASAIATLIPWLFSEDVAKFPFCENCDMRCKKKHLGYIHDIELNRSKILDMISDQSIKSHITKSAPFTVSNEKRRHATLTKAECPNCEHTRLLKMEIKDNGKLIDGSSDFIYLDNKQSAILDELQ